MISVLTSKYISTNRRGNTSILPDSCGDLESIQVHGFYWPRVLCVPEMSSAKKKEEKKATKTKRRRKFSVNEETYQVSENIKPSPNSRLNLYIALSPSRDEVSTENRQPQHCYCWIPKSSPRSLDIRAKNMSRIVPEKPLKKLSPRKAVRSACTAELWKG